MKHLFFHCLLLCVFNPPANCQETVLSRESPITEIQWQGQNYQLVFVDLTKQTLSLHWKNSKDENISSLENMAKQIGRRSFLFATNAGMFHPDRSPVGLHIEKGKALVPLDRKKKQPGNFYLKPNGVFFLGKNGKASVMETDRFAKTFPPNAYKNQIELATQSGPILVSNGTIHPAFNKDSKNRYVRSGVGVLGDGRSVVFGISNLPVNLHSFASLFRDLLGSQNALYLDGAVSQFHAPEKGLESPGGYFGGILAVTKGR